MMTNKEIRSIMLDAIRKSRIEMLIQVRKEKIDKNKNRIK